MSKKYRIIGAGRLGSMMAFSISLSGFADLLEIYDKDILSEKNLPYLFSRDPDLVGIPKAYALGSILSEYFPESEMNVYWEEFDQTKMDPEFFTIDCRDSKDELNGSRIKLFCDGDYGLAILNPEQKDDPEIEEGRYRFKRNDYKTLRFAMYICDKYIFRETPFVKRKKRKVCMK